MKKVSLVYFQHDLRIHDHPSLTFASQRELPIIGVYLLNQLDQQKTKWGFEKIGPYR
jgi:deoxyribodipyrimidine photolyase